MNLDETSRKKKEWREGEREGKKKDRREKKSVM